MIESQEKSKPFRLLKYFTFTSLIVMFAGTIVISAFSTYLVRKILLKKSEDYAILLVENLNHQVFMQFVIPVALQYGKIQLRKEEQFERLDKVVRSTLHSFKVELVNFHDMNNIISYSFNQELIGKEVIGGTGYLNALEGRSTSNLIQSGNFWEIHFGFPKESRLVTYAPLRAEKPLSIMSGPVLGVVEIVQDLSAEYAEIYKIQILVNQVCALVMFILFLMLRLIVKRGERIVEKRAEERMALKEALHKAKHLSSLGEMIAGVSHEIRNPLGIIRSSAELLQKKMKQLDPSNTIPTIIVEEAGRLNDIITDFLNYARPSAPNLVPCSLTAIMTKAVEHLSVQARGEGYRIQNNCGSDLPAVRADGAMLYQAFLNVLINAMEAMPGGGDIQIEGARNGEEIIVTVLDKGGGLPDDVREKIWDPFFTTKESGTGLGLGIVKNIVSAHGGSVRVQNRQDGGARVTINLPIEQRGL